MEGSRTEETSMSLDYGTNAKHSNEGINVNLMVYISSDYHLMGDGDPDLPSGDGNYRCGGE